MSTTIITVPRKTSTWHRPARLGYIVIFLTFGIGGVWTSTAKISSAVIAPAVIGIQSNTKTVSHLEGGIVSEILVQENQHVNQGDVVLRLSDIEAKASLATAQNQLILARVQEARLTAERDQKSDIDLPPEIQAKMDEPIVKQALADQQAAFMDRRRSLQGQISILEARIEGFETEIQGLKIQEAATRREVALVEQELVGYHELLNKQLMPLSRVLDKEREQTRLQGIIGQSISDQAKANISIGETKLDIQEARHKFQEETASAILEIRAKISDLTQKVLVTTDIMHRIDIRAPVSGHVQGLTVHSIGQVIRGGEPLMTIVPDEERLVVNAHFAPTDIDRIQRASHVEVRFPAFHSRTTPVILGEITSISSDRLTDETTHEPYYLGVISVNTLQIPTELRDRLRAGMPGEVIAPLAKRSVLSYLVSPLQESWQKSLREQ